MLSRRRPILMRVRISFDALRLCLLVAAGVTSGYLWRAAFESTAPAEERSAAAPRVVQPAPAPPVVRIAPHHLTTPHREVKATARVVAEVVAQRTHRASTPIASTPQPASSPPTASPTPTPTPKPSPTPAPQPGPTTNPPPTSTPQSISTPVQQVSPPPPTTTPVANPPVQQPPTHSDDGTRPGWGNGDENHDHTGPGGKKP
jgi:hypothetical protein